MVQSMIDLVLSEFYARMLAVEVDGNLLNIEHRLEQNLCTKDTLVNLRSLQQASVNNLDDKSTIF
jgi:hypothetical protein